MSERLPERQGEAIRRDRPLAFRFERRRVEAFEGDTVGSALAAAGVTITGRSVTYHRPRGLSCMTGACPNCLMQVDGVSNVRACTEPVREGMRVERQNAWPSADLDVRAWSDTFSFVLPPGSSHKVLHRPRWAWPLVERSVRAKAGLGTVPTEADHRRRRRVDLHPDVLVIGAGAAGLAAAAAAGRVGASVVLLEQGHEVGGHLLGDRPGTKTRSSLVRETVDAGVRVLRDTVAFGVFGGRLVAAAGPDVLYRIRAARVIFATGSVEQSAVFPGNDLPGVMLSSAAQLLLHRFSVLPGRRAVVMTGDNLGYTTAWALKDAGASVTVVDLRAEGGWPEGFPVLSGSAIVAAHGRRRVKGVTVAPPGSTSGQKVSCDLVVIACGDAPSTNLLAQAGVPLAFDERCQAFLPVRLPERIAAVGAVAGARSAAAATVQGRLAGSEAAAALGRPVDRDEMESLRAQAATTETAGVLPPESSARSGKQFACLCMDVTAKDLTVAVAEGFDSMEHLKRYTTTTMGPCQGKACLVSSQRLCARETGRSFSETAPTTARPPWVPVELGTLAGPRRTPRKETTLHDRHVAAGAEFTWAGDWRRPHHYTSPEREVDAVRTRVGLMDVGARGKFRIEGPQAVHLLERLYPCRFVDLAVGRIRHGLMLNDEGVILDHGAVVRLGEHSFFVTVMTGDTWDPERWITWCSADAQLDARVLNVTGAFGAVNLAGPRAREVMSTLTDADVSAEAIPYLGAARIDVVGVSSLVLRIGFVGELGYEIHFPSAYGEHVWDAIMEAGATGGIQPFGMEAERILRLEKQHLLIGQDTDAGSHPLEVGLGSLVDDDLDDVSGHRALRAPPPGPVAERLVGFTASDRWLPPEGASVVRDDRWVGRVTSARRSATVGAVIGLAWVPADLAADGSRFEIRFGGSHTVGTVRAAPVYDPDGARFRS
ncbi:MAG TPA: 2Fe-2S iron-sulfur cluster-binding protein [Actinomycetota bacterium]|nr:2Fe-2S iron-sulfur cluster-binding protein [Actinomycetota bacterium]